MIMIIPKIGSSSICRVVAPSRTLKIIDENTRQIAISTLLKCGIIATYSKFCEESDQYFSSSIQSRVDDLHEAFLDKKVNIILSVIGGFRSIQILSHIDYNIIKQNPKFVCGYSDITLLLNAIYSKTGMITYYGPHFSSFGMKKGNEFTVKNFNYVIRNSSLNEVVNSSKWSEDDWFIDQETRNFQLNKSPVIIQEGEANGKLIGGNINSFCLLNGTEYQPSLKNKILFLESDDLNGNLTDQEFDRRLESILLQKDGNLIQGLVIGKFKSKSNMNVQKIKDIVRNKKQLNGRPVVYGYGFGHTMPMITIPIGGESYIHATSSVPIWKFNT
jgi:muramoyltetrapeptide carboxypeptidase LdcA involved in peptidoglycan recycling